MSLNSAFLRTTGTAQGTKTALDATGKSAQKLNTQAGVLNTGIGKAKTSIQQTGRELKNIKSGSEATAKAIGKVGKESGKAAPGLDKAGRSLKKTAKNTDGLNRSMKKNFLAQLVSLFQPLIEKVVEMASKSTTMRRIMKKAFEVIGKAVDQASKIIGPLMKGLGSLMSLVWGGIKKAVLPIALWFMTDLPDAFTAVKKALHAAWDALPESAKTIFRAIGSAVKDPINSLIGMINTLLTSLNGIHVTVPSWIPHFGGKGFTIDVPPIPKLAEGGIVTPRSGGVPAIVAEAGESEAVMPLSKLDRLLTRTAVAARAAGNSSDGGGGFHIQNYYARADDPRDTAMALMFLAKARG
ncbi:phage tail protein [Streptomyces huiliensis]|uniref:phage tail protein n=1 Tax=Streptomyces huiliensis TaxID=2876027 RepID=UPI001CC036D9|nr:phage tail protein [Streptomyces huiliensis]MBZ4320616.1 phage tail protein [Streptomyces huiliensis]